MLFLLNKTIHKAGPTGPSFVAPWLLFSHVVRCHKEGLTLQLAQNRAARLALKCTLRANVNNMHVNLSWLKAEERLTSSLPVFARSVDKLNAPSCLFKLLAHTPDTHTYPTRHATRGLFTVPKSRTEYAKRTVLHRAVTTWNSIPHQVTDASSRIRFKNRFYGTAGTVKRYTHRYRDTHGHANSSTRTLHTRTL